MTSDRTHLSENGNSGGSPSGIFTRGLPHGLTTALPGWLAEQRWFASKGRPIQGVRAVSTTTLQDAAPQLDHLVIAVEHDGGEELYQVLTGLRHELPEYLVHAQIGVLLDENVVAYDATFDPELAERLLELIDADAQTDQLRFVREPGVELDTGLSSRPIGVEQSNTSIVFGHQYILKIFRRISTGTSPDLELHRALQQVGCAHIAPPLGAIEGELDGEPVTYGILQKFLPNTADGWAMATASVRDLMAEADLHANEVGGDFASEAYRLGEAVAAVHEDLARALGSDFSDAEDLAHTVEDMHQRLDTVRASVPELDRHAEEIHTSFDEAVESTQVVPIQRIHGDLHLGQVLRSVTGWVLIDFEGEPATKLARRVARMSPMRDVAGMLRSFDYAAYHLLSGNPNDTQLTYRAAEWSSRNRAAFCDGYAVTGIDPRSQAPLVRALELDKAVYEVAYEAGNRPSWLPIPLASIDRLTMAKGEEL